MIVRIVRARLAPARLAELRAALSRAGEGAGPQPGLVRTHVGARQLGDRLEVLGLDFWGTPEASEQAPPPGTAGLPAMLSSLVPRTETAHFEIDEALERPASGPIVAIRLTVGRFSRPGADIEMQELLRERVPSIGPEMIEAYVGRRMVGRAVEVTFITTWVAEPAGRPLDQPLWPDIAFRYDEFLIALYAPIDRPPRAGR